MRIRVLDSPLVPVAGLLLAFVATAGLLQMIVQRRNRERRGRLTEWAAHRGFTIEVGDKPLAAAGLDPTLTGLPLFARRVQPRVRCVLRGHDPDGVVLHVFDFRYDLQTGRSSAHAEQTVAAFWRPRIDLPAFSMAPQGFLERFGLALGEPEVDVSEPAGFARHYQLRGGETERVRQHFAGGAAAALASRPGWSVQGTGPWIVVFRHQHTVPVERLMAFLDDARAVSAAIARA